MKKGIDYTGISVICLCHDGQGRYLVEERSDKCRDEHFKWSPVGAGAIEYGETVEDAVRREIKEECDAEAELMEFLGYTESFRTDESGNEIHWLALDFKVKIDPGQVKITEPEKTLQHKWVPISEIPEPQHSLFPEYIEKYKNKL